MAADDIDNVEYVGPGLTWGGILSTWVISMWSNDIKCKYVYVPSAKFSTWRVNDEQDLWRHMASHKATLYDNSSKIYKLL